MQAFFAEALAGGQTLILPASAKTHSSTPRFKKKSAVAEELSMVRLLLEDGSNSRDAIVWFNEKATMSFDGSFDAYKLSKSLGPINLWTNLGGTDYAINGISMPETTVEIPLGIHLESSGSYTLSASELNGLDNFTVTLLDKTTNASVDLKAGTKLSFNSADGDFEDRFVLKITAVITGIEEIALPASLFNTYAFNGMLNIELLSDEWNGKQCEVKLTDLTGRLFKIVRDAEFWKNSTVQIPIGDARGVYIVEIRSGMMRYIGKVMAR